MSLVDGPSGRPPDPGPRSSRLGELSGALGDLGTFLPFVVAALGSGILAPAPVLMGFAVGYALVASVYRLPVSVQPMKALGAMRIAGALGPSDLVWAGALLGAVLLAFAASPRLDRAARAVPQSVVTGLQAGLGLMLMGVAIGLMAADWRLALPALAVLACAYRWPRAPWALLVIATAMVLPLPGDPSGVAGAMAPLPPAVDATAAGSFAWTGVDVSAVLAGLAAQLPLTLLNAVVVTVAVSRSLYPLARRTVTERRLAATSGALNLLLVPLGALPMCHGAGGVTAHHRFGARGAGAPLTLAILCATCALAGPGVMEVLARIPLPVVGALLTYAALDLILTPRMRDARPDCRPVIAAAALATWGGGALVGLLVGLTAEGLRQLVLRRTVSGPTGLAQPHGRPGTAVSARKPRPLEQEIGADRDRRDGDQS